MEKICKVTVNLEGGVFVKEKGGEKKSRKFLGRKGGKKNDRAVVTADEIFIFGGGTICGGAGRKMFALIFLKLLIKGRRGGQRAIQQYWFGGPRDQRWAVALLLSV